MNVNGIAHRSIWLGENGIDVEIIDQTLLPHRYEVVKLTCVEDARKAIANMQVRGAPLIGVTAAYGIYLAMREEASVDFLNHAYIYSSNIIDIYILIKMDYILRQ